MVQDFKRLLDNDLFPGWNVTETTGISDSLAHVHTVGAIT